MGFDANGDVMKARLTINVITPTFAWTAELISLGGLQARDPPGGGWYFM